jgi:hypothetical protein
MAASLQYAPNKKSFEVTVGELSWAAEIAKGDESIMLHHDRGCYVVALDGSDLEGLEPNTVYELVKVATIRKADGEIEIGDED